MPAADRCSNVDRNPWVALRKGIYQGAFVGVLLCAGLSGSAAYSVEFHAGEHVEIAGRRTTSVFVGGETISVDATSNDDAYFAGSQVRMTLKTTENLFSAGGELESKGTSARLAMLAGGQIHLKDSSFRDLDVAGGQIVLSRVSISEKLLAAGGAIRFESDSRVKGSALVAGGKVELLGAIDGETWVRGGEVTLSGHFGKKLNVNAGKLIVDASAVFDDAFEYSANKATISPQAKFRGKKTQLATAANSTSKMGVVFGVLAGVLFGVGCLLVPFVILLFFPNTIERIRKKVLNDFWACLGRGIGYSLAIALVWFAMLISIVGTPLALASIPFFGALKFLAWGAAVVIVGEWIHSKLFKKRPSKSSSLRHRVGVILLGGLATGLVFSLAWIGGPFVFLLFFASFGALLSIARESLKAL